MLSFRWLISIILILAYSVLLATSSRKLVRRIHKITKNFTIIHTTKKNVTIHIDHNGHVTRNVSITSINVGSQSRGGMNPMTSEIEGNPQNNGLYNPTTPKTTNYNITAKEMEDLLEEGVRFTSIRNKKLIWILINTKISEISLFDMKYQEYLVFLENSYKKEIGILTELQEEQNELSTKTNSGEMDYCIKRMRVEYIDLADGKGVRKIQREGYLRTGRSKMVVKVKGSGEFIYLNLPKRLFLGDQNGWIKPKKNKYMVFDIDNNSPIGAKHTLVVGDRTIILETISK